MDLYDFDSIESRFKTEMWDIPKGKFDSAMQKLADACGDRFGKIVYALNNDDDFAAKVVQAVFRPEQVFCENLTEVLNVGYPLSELDTIFSGEGSSMTHLGHSILERVFSRMQERYPIFNVPDIESLELHGRCNLYTVMPLLYMSNKSVGIIAIHCIILELSLCASIMSELKNRHKTASVIFEQTGFGWLTELDEVKDYLGTGFSSVLVRAGLPNHFMSIEDAARSVLDILKILKNIEIRSH